jgi:hypothetical protein
LNTKRIIINTGVRVK